MDGAVQSIHLRRRLPLTARGGLVVLTLLVYAAAYAIRPDPWPLPVLPAVASDCETPFFAEVFLHQEQEGRMSHACTLAPLADGSVAAVWYAGSREGAGDVRLYLARLDPASGQWGRPEALLDTARASRDLSRWVRKLGNATLHRDHQGRLHLFYASVTLGGWSGTALNHKVSDDGGNTWRPSRRLYLSPFINLTNNVRNKAIDLDDGSFLLPVYHEFLHKFSEALRFDPESGRYEKVRISRSGRAIQPTLVQGPEGRLTAVMRALGCQTPRRALLSTSSDGGRTWEATVPTALYNPDASLDAIELSDGRLLAVANDTEDGRHRLALLISDDGGMQFTLLHVLEYGPPHSEYSYPSLIRAHDQRIHLAYTYNRRQIKHLSFNEAWLRTRETPP